ncbi:hypothetical protein [Streptomyces sp. KS 21]|uniref:hypothetical protein n=1 Tax=Streptomyces sp. KS 21 TaxID=2485150 RepID=UPI0010627F37|nr:hypothetical protein [Streptomyces sp. KS 21]TDU67863.1 hypothetical protein EDD91_7922 [Streptomyces sp. KS 21]
MTVPLPPEDPDRAPFHLPGTDSVQAHEAVMRVVEAYNARLAAARSSPGRDAADVVAGWREARDRAVDDGDLLATAGAEETARIAMEYASRLRELQED